MNEEDLKARTKRFALRVIDVVHALPENTAGWAIGRQLVRSGTSVGANYRASCLARSKAEFIAKLGIVEEEADETCFWLELITEAKLIPSRRIAPLLTEANELVAIISASRKTARKR